MAADAHVAPDLPRRPALSEMAAEVGNYRCPVRRRRRHPGALTALTAQGEQVDVAGLIRRLTDSHTARMAAAGLNN